MSWRTREKRGANLTQTEVTGVLQGIFTWKVKRLSRRQVFSEHTAKFQFKGVFVASLYVKSPVDHLWQISLVRKSSLSALALALDGLCHCNHLRRIKKGRPNSSPRTTVWSKPSPWEPPRKAWRNML